MARALSFSGSGSGRVTGLRHSQNLFSPTTNTRVASALQMSGLELSYTGIFCVCTVHFQSG